jgi:hypothetical protein
MLPLSITLVMFYTVYTDNFYMRTPEEVVNFCKQRIRQLKLGQVETLEKAGISTTIFAMSLKRNVYMKVETMNILAQLLNVSVGEMLGCNNSDLPSDIQEMVDMLLILPEEDRKLISMNIKNYCDVRRSETNK